MTRKLSKIAFWNVFMILIVIQVNGISSGQLTPPGVTETEIRRKWKEFKSVKGSRQIRGAFPYRSCFEDAAHKYGVPLPLLVAVARGESNFNPNARSLKDCYGIMQIQWPGTAKDLGILNKTELLDPCINIHAGARYLSWLLDRYDGDTYLAVAGYNHGPNAVSSQYVPDGARWYAAYIYRHLTSVISKPYAEIGKTLLLRFTYYEKAAGFVTYLGQRLKGVPLDVFKSRRYTYDVYVTYNSTKEKDEFLKRLVETTGIRPLDGERS